jgi:hypothetical protein
VPLAAREQKAYIQRAASKSDFRIARQAWPRPV